MSAQPRHTRSLLVAALTLLAASCAKEPQDSTQPAATKGKIGMTCMDLTNPFFKLIANVMEEEAKKCGYELVALSGELDPAKQNNQLADFAAQGYDFPQPGGFQGGRGRSQEGSRGRDPGVHI
jgi:ABC-type sugar transport system substrate-binding protein